MDESLWMDLVHTSVLDPSCGIHRQASVLLDHSLMEIASSAAALLCNLVACTEDARVIHVILMHLRKFNGAAK